MRKLFVAVGSAIAVVSASSLVTNDANAMSGAYGAGVIAAAGPSNAVEKIACWWSRRWGRTVCSGPALVGPPVVVVPPVVVGPRYYGPRRNYRRHW
jgi:hypothetical protein